MDEVKAMSRAGEFAGSAVCTGLETAREGIVRVGRKGVAGSSRASRAAQQELANYGLSPQQLEDLILAGMGQVRAEFDKTGAEMAQRGRRVRKELDRSTRATRKEFVKNIRRARRVLATKIEPSGRDRRHWPLLLVLFAALGAAAFVWSRRLDGGRTEDGGHGAAEPQPQPPGE